ncbi:MAG: hypothetical protein QG597_902, partial [Actinomycetota bacterium]|nr:hypothetical protein [Actinomycetota bacterium]
MFAGIAIIVALATTCQLLARIIRLPALLLLLPAGFAAGATIGFLDPARMFGDLFSPLVGFAVALILFHGGMELFEQPLGHKDRRLIRTLVWVGGAFTWACATLAVLWLFGLPQNLALLAGAILIVSGPTVVGPLLDFVRPTTRIRRILAWEGTLVDPLGALVAVIVFSGVQASRLGNHKEGLAAFLLGIGVGVVGAAVGTILIRV